MQYVFQSYCTEPLICIGVAFFIPYTLLSIYIAILTTAFGVKAAEDLESDSEKPTKAFKINQAGGEKILLTSSFHE